MWIPVLTAIVGTVIGLFAAEVKRHWEDRRLARRIRNRVLYLQLDVLHSVRRSDVRGVSTQLGSILESRLGVPASTILENIPIETVRAMTDAFRRAIGGDVDGTLVARYQEAIDELAPVDPVAAFRMSGRSNLTRLRSALGSYFSELSRMPELAFDRASIPKLGEGAYAEILAAAIASLEKDIRAVAGKVDPATRRDVEVSLHRMSDTTLGAEQQQQLNRIIDELLPKTDFPKPPES